jgi:hypothetical protein
MTNADVADLYSRVTVGTKIIVLPNHGHVAQKAVPATPARFTSSAVY